MVYSEARGEDVIIGYRNEWDRAKVKSERQQREMDASRKPLTDEERAVYTNTSRLWKTAEKLGPVAILDSLIDKGWVQSDHPLRGALERMIYQRVHSLDDMKEAR